MPLHLPSGGTNINSERNRLGQRCDVLVATPGRLIDHLQNSGLTPKLAGIRTLVGGRMGVGGWAGGWLRGLAGGWVSRCSA